MNSNRPGKRVAKGDGGIKTLESIESRQDGTRHARFRLQFGERVNLRVNA